MNWQTSLPGSPADDKGTSRPPWGWAILLGVVFFIAHPHSLTASRQLAERDALGAKEERQAMANADAVEEGSPRRRVSLLALAAVATVALVHGAWRRISLQGVLGWSLAALGVLIGLSCLWADDSLLAIRRSASLGLLALGALVVAERLSGNDLLWLVVVVLTSYLTLGVLAEAALGTMQPWNSEYRFAGTLHPNRQGMNCAVLILAATTLALQGGRKSIYVPILIVAGACLALTRSRTSMGSVVLGSAVLWLLTAHPARSLQTAVAGSALLAALLFVGAAWKGDALDTRLRSLLLMGRNDGGEGEKSLTGRIPLWEECLRHASYRPILGYGYKAFWTPQRILKISNNQGWSVMAAHSGYVDMALNLGFLGLSAFVAMLTAGIVAAWRTARTVQTPAAAFAAAMLCWLAANSLLESFLDEPLFVSFVALTLLMKLGAVRQEAADFELAVVPRRLATIGGPLLPPTHS